MKTGGSVSLIRCVDFIPNFVRVVTVGRVGRDRSTILVQGGPGGMGGPFGGMGGPMEFGKNKSKFQETPETGITFDDVAVGITDSFR